MVQNLAPEKITCEHAYLIPKSSAILRIFIERPVNHSHILTRTFCLYWGNRRHSCPLLFRCTGLVFSCPPSQTALPPCIPGESHSAPNPGWQKLHILKSRWYSSEKYLEILLSNIVTPWPLRPKGYYLGLSGILVVLSFDLIFAGNRLEISYPSISVWYLYKSHSTVLGATFVNVTVCPTIVNVTF